MMSFRSRRTRQFIELSLYSVALLVFSLPVLFLVVEGLKVLLP